MDDGQIRPARLAIPDRAQLRVQCERVDLHHHAVGPVVERRENCFEARDLLVRLSQIGDELVVRLHRESPLAELFQQFVLRGDGKRVPGSLDVEAKDPEAPAARDLGVELAERSGGRVARVRERGLPCLLPLTVELGEARLREIHLAAHLHELGPGLAPPLETQGDVVDRAQVGRHVLDAVAPGRADREDAVAVGEAHGRAVDLHLERVSRLPDLRDQPGVPLLPLREFRLVEGVPERQHGHQMAVLAELVGRLGADAVGGAVGGPELGMLRFEVLQLAKRAVVLGVGDLGLVQYVVRVVGTLQQPPELGGAGGRGWALHRPLASS